MLESMQGLKRTNMCAELSASDAGKKVTLAGWVQRRRDLGNLIFIWLRDRSGLVQLTFLSDADKELLEKAETLRAEFVIAVQGTVCLRDEQNINPDLKTGEIEIAVEELRILNTSLTPPFAIEENSDVKDEIRMTYRYLDLRRPDIQRNLILRHKAARIIRNYYDEQGFLEIETPMLIKSTPEGARDFLVPSRVHPGKFYALPQSPQQYKQLLMLSGMDRYFQIVKCFRDEDLRADRQPEFTQIDLEMSFVDIDDVIRVNEGLLKRVFKELLDVDVQLPMQRMTYTEAMSRFGSDKPDTRFGFELRDLSDIVKNCGFQVFTGAVAQGGSVRAINVNGHAKDFSRKEIDALGEFAKTYRAKGLAWIVVNEDGSLKSPIAKFLTDEEIQGILERMNAREGDLLLIVADKDKVVFDSLGNLRLEVARRLNLLDPKQYNFLWVTEFPLLEYDEEEGRYTAMHHPFTAPMEEDVKYMDTDPGKIRAKAYDIILNGNELGGGSLRIYQKDMQEKMFRLLNISPEEIQTRFGFLLDAFKYGAPPHGGLAFGFDRLVMLMAGADSIREVMAFPKQQNASELMTNAPETVDTKQLDELYISTHPPKKENE